MKKFFKIAGLVLLGLVLFVFISALFISKDVHVEREISINAPKEKVWNHVNTLGGMLTWSPFNAHDPNSKNTFEGEQGSIGSVHKWESEVIGTGKQTLAKLEPMNRVETDLHFMEPFEAKADAFINLSGDESATKVTWGYDTRYSYPTNFLLLFMNMDELMGKEFNSGLAKLKAICESE